MSDPSDSYEDEMTSEHEEPPMKRKPRRKSTNSNIGATPRLRHKSGSASYADLITNAITSNKESRLSLAEIYDWMATNVPSLQSQRYLHSSKGWKNAVRHTLSINPRFQKVTRIGRPSWWTLESDSLPLSLQEAHEQRDNDRIESPNEWSTRLSVYNEEELQMESFRARSDSEPAYFLSRMKRPTNSKPGPPTSGGEDQKFQLVKVWQDDGTIGSLNVPLPVFLKTTVCEETGTQTDDPEIFSFTSVPCEQQTGQSKYENDYDCTCGSLSYDVVNPPSTSNEQHSFHWLATIADDWREVALDQSVTESDDVFRTNWFDNL